MRKTSLPLRAPTKTVPPVAAVRGVVVLATVGVAFGIAAVRGVALVGAPRVATGMAALAASLAALALALVFRLARRKYQLLQRVADELATNSPSIPAIVASAIAEELLFRGALGPWVGTVPAAVLFAAVHRLRGGGGLLWSGAAFAFALISSAFAAVDRSLLAAILFHGMLNVLMAQIAKRDAAEEARQVRVKASLGGLLRR